MKHLLIFFIGLLSTQILFSQKIQTDYLFTNASIIPLNKEVVLKNKDIAIKDGKIVSIIDSKKGKFESKQTIDCKGKYLIPTFGDAHVHLPDEEKDLEKYLILNLINGVTKLRSMRGDDKHLEWRKKYNTTTSIFPKMYLSATPIHRSQDFTNEQLSEYVKHLKDSSFDFIKVLSVKNQNIFIQLDKLCKENNIKMAGHFPSDSKGLVIADDIIFNSNLNSIEHLGGLVGDPTTFESRIRLMKDKNIYSCPTLRWYEIAYGQFDINTIQKQKGIEHIDPKAVTEWVDKTVKYREKMGEKVLKKEIDFYAKEIDERLRVINRLNKDGIKLLLSPDSSSKFIIPGFGMMDEIKLYKKAGLSNFDILKAGTVNFANYFNDTTTGSIEVGKNADFLFLNENPLENIEVVGQIDGIFFNNKYLNKQELVDLATSVLPNKN
jgi:hypothetical protein